MPHADLIVFEPRVEENWFYFTQSPGTDTWMKLAITNHVKHIFFTSYGIFSVRNIFSLLLREPYNIKENSLKMCIKNCFLITVSCIMVLRFKVFVLPFKTLVFEYFCISNSKCNVLKPGTWIVNWDEYFFLRISARQSSHFIFFNGVSRTFLVTHK